ncbi:MAG: hypothetical protein JRH04_09190, partial [Deltaproteobacteria bacterium]|nr:hypothetical protein [Deltaproteobacteria bacterium]
MNYYRKASILFLGFALLLGACVPSNKPRSKIEFYTLEYDLSKKAALKSLPIVIRIERF